MKRKFKSIYIIEIILLIFLGMFKILILDKYSNLTNIVNIIFWICLGIGLYIFYGFPKNKNYLNRSSINIIIISLLVYILVTYLLGLFVGFHRNDINIFLSLKNTAIYLITYILIELSRYIILSKNPSKFNIVIFTIELIISDVLIEINGVDISTAKRIFITVSTIVLPIIARESLYTYITYNIGYKPTLVLRLILSVYIYFLPIVPALGNYLIAITELLLPFVIFLEINKNLRYKEKYGLHGRKTLRNVITIITISFLVTIAMLTSGFFKYKLVAIISGSMEPVYYRGDAVIIVAKKAKEINKGDILAFNVGNGIVTHRVVKIEEVGGIYTFTTKGDNNDANDTFEIHNDDVIGTVNYILKYAGFPTVWVNEILERR